MVCRIPPVWARGYSIPGMSYKVNLYITRLPNGLVCHIFSMQCGIKRNACHILLNSRASGADPGGGQGGLGPPPNIAPPNSQARIQGGGARGPCPPPRGPRGPCPPPPLQNPGSAYGHCVPVVGLHSDLNGIYTWCVYMVYIWYISWI